MIARDVMTTDVITVKRNTPVPEVARILATNNISGVPVVDENNCVVGIVSEADLLLKQDKARVPHRLALFGFWVVPEEPLIEAYKAARGGTTAEDVMTRSVVVFDEEDPVSKIAEVMVKKRINRVPILRDCKLAGIVSRADLLRAIAGL